MSAQDIITSDYLVQDFIHKYRGQDRTSKLNLKWYVKSKCFICNEFIFHPRNEGYKASRIVHQSCMPKKNPKRKIVRY